MRVQLQFFEDETNGQYGLAHSNSLNEGFNAFFSAIGLFHDIMEHYFEGIHPNFSGKYAFNYGGEIAASGHSAWYIHGLGMWNRWSDLENINSIEDAFTRSVGLEDEICYGYIKFGKELLCKPRNVYQVHPNYSQFVHYHWNYWQDLMDKHPEPEGCEFEIADALTLRKSLSLNKLETLYGWGYHTAKKLIPLNDHNIAAIHQLYTDLKWFTKTNSAEDLAINFKYFTAYIKPGNKFSYRFTVSDGINEFDAMDQDSWYPEEQF
jgi:hypothetical protein